MMLLVDQRTHCSSSGHGHFYIGDILTVAFSLCASNGLAIDLYGGMFPVEAGTPGEGLIAKVLDGA